MKPFLWRIIFYVFFVSGLSTIIDFYKKAIHIYHASSQPYRITQNQNNNYGHELSSSSSRRMMIVRRSTSVSPPIVVAPWTILARNKHNPEKVQPRSFVFAYIAKLDSDYGVSFSQADKRENEQIKKQTSHRLCARSTKFSGNYQGTFRCKINVELLRCVSCSEKDGIWYSAVSQTGAVFGQVYNGTSLNYPNFNDGPFMYQQLDIAVPIAGQDQNLRKFTTQLGRAIKQFRSGLFGAKINIRLLITRFPFDKPSIKTQELEDLRLNLTETTGLVDIADEIVFVPVEGVDQFSRAKAINALHRITYHDDNSVLAVVDVDLQIGPKFLRNCLTYPFPNGSAYFPIMFSAYDPDSVLLVDQFLPKTKHNIFSDHHGLWRKFSFGMYVIAGSDASYLSMDENFVGWGGEDNDFFSRVGKKLNIIRLHETGLTHAWHPKHCQLGSFVEKKYFQACIGSMAHLEGSQLGMHLKYLKEHDPNSFNEIMAKVVDKEDDEKDATVEFNIKADQIYEENPTVIVGVISSRANFRTRVKSIIKTWADPFNIPDGILIRFFVGTPPEGNDFYIKSREDDIAYLADISGIKDLSMIVVMDDVVDDEYPPVRKNTAMIENLEKIVEAFENNIDAPTTFQWIYKVDDDAYVNFDGMFSFLRTRSYDSNRIYGERGIGREEDREGLKQGGLVKPYCTGGPGYIMSRKTVMETAPRLKECVDEFDKSKYREFLWHSDSVIGICIYKSTGAGCWDDRDYYTHRIFRHNLYKEDPFIPTTDLAKTIAIHPFKDHVSMMMQHSRYVDLASSLQ